MVFAFPREDTQIECLFLYVMANSHAFLFFEIY